MFCTKTPFFIQKMGVFLYSSYQATQGDKNDRTKGQFSR